MLIQSKFKDYYDYLAGIWGVDEKLVLDRTKFTPKLAPFKDYDKVTLYICDYKIQGLAMKGEILWGDEMLPYIKKDYKTGLPKEDKGKPDSYWMKGFEGYEHVWTIDLPERYRPWNWKTYYILKHPVKIEGSTSPNQIENCPILLSRWDGDYEHNPILKDLNFHQHTPAEVIWIKLTEWLAKKHEEVVQDTRTNKEKILSNGFDLKTSFRK